MFRNLLSSGEPIINKGSSLSLNTFKMSGHIIIEMGFAPLVRQNALSVGEWMKLFAPAPALAIIIDDSDYDTESDAGWYPAFPQHMSGQPFCNMSMEALDMMVK